MQLKTSFFNQTLFKKNLTRSWPMWAMVSFAGALFPLAYLIEVLRHNGVATPLEFTEIYYHVLVYAVPIISLVYAILCAMMVWSYLFNARSAGLMHTLPIRREGLFVTNFLSGMVMMAIPYCVVGIITILLSLLCGGFEPVGLLVTILGVAGDSFFYFSTATAVAFITGNVFAMPALYLIFHFLAAGTEMLVCSLARGFIYGVSSSYTGAAEFLSPTVYLMRRMSVDSSYIEETMKDEFETWSRSVLTEVHLVRPWIIAVYALVGVALAVIAYLLYTRRRTESAGDVVSVGWMKPVFLVGVTAMAALSGGQLLYALFGVAFDGSMDRIAAAPMAICMWVAGTIGYYIARMLLAKSLRVFKGSWPGLAALAVGCAAVCCVLSMDLLNITGHVPAMDQIRQVELYTANNNYTLTAGEDDALIEEIRDLHSAIAADAAWERAQSRYYGWDEDAAYQQVVLTYMLKNGKVIRRNYDLCMTRDRLAQPGTVDDKLDRLVNGTAMKQKRLHADDGYLPDGGYLYTEFSENNYGLNSREATAVLEAVKQDGDAWGTYDWFRQGDDDAYAINLEISFRKAQDGGYMNDWISIALRPGMTHTAQTLLDLNLIREADLITYAQLWEMESNGSWDEERVWEEVPARPAVAEEFGVGVIGGADGPTAVYVTGVAG